MKVSIFLMLFIAHFALYGMEQSSIQRVAISRLPGLRSSSFERIVNQAALERQAGPRDPLEKNEGNFAGTRKSISKK